MKTDEGKGWKPSCTCNMLGLEPAPDCWVHSHPNICQCPYCGQFRGLQPCKRCGNAYGLGHIARKYSGRGWGDYGSPPGLSDDYS